MPVVVSFHTSTVHVYIAKTSHWLVKPEAVYCEFGRLLSDVRCVFIVGEAKYSLTLHSHSCQIVDLMTSVLFN